ncbi:hypothetical protein PN824_003719 [Morganella morganii]|nr:hypothetical protein [Morganella morganii]
MPDNQPFRGVRPADFTFTAKILNGCLVLIPDNEDIRAIKQQNQQQQAQLTAIRHTMRKLMVEYTRS